MKSSAFLRDNTPLLPGKLYKVSRPAWACQLPTARFVPAHKFDILLLEDTPILFLAEEIDHVKILVFDRVWHLSTSVLLVEYC